MDVEAVKGKCLLPARSGEGMEIPAEQASSTLTVTRWRGSQRAMVSDALAQEVPVALVYNGISHVVMMATPADLEDFAYGFSFTEGIISAASQIYGVEVKPLVLEDGETQGIELHIDLATQQFVALKAQRRNLTGRTGCGLCGAESLQQVFKSPMSGVRSRVEVSLSAIEAALNELKLKQPLQQLTGATHACAVVNAQGQTLYVREDVGRHNALDKLIGCLLRSGQDLLKFWAEHWVLTTSRASYEMVQKVAVSGGRALVALSAPTLLAVDLARDYDFLLVGFAKKMQCVVYSGELAEDDKFEG